MSEDQGGSGGTYARNTRHTRLVGRALRERWRIRKGLRGTLIDRLAQILEDAASGPREVTAAAKAILSASKINLENISVAVKAIEQTDLEVRMTEIERKLDVQKKAREEYSGGQAYPTTE